MLSASLDRTLRLWNLESGRQVAVFNGHQAAVRQCAFLSNSEALSCSADGTLKRWRLDGTLRRTLYGHTGPVRSFTLSDAEPRSVISCSDDRTLIEWHLAEEPPE
jgi:WD40 repeat protein